MDRPRPKFLNYNTGRWEYHTPDPNYRYEPIKEMDMTYLNKTRLMDRPWVEISAQETPQEWFKRQNSKPDYSFLEQT